MKITSLLKTKKLYLKQNNFVKHNLVQETCEYIKLMM